MVQSAIILWPNRYSWNNSIIKEEKKLEEIVEEEILEEEILDLDDTTYINKLWATSSKPVLLLSGWI